MSWQEDYEDYFIEMWGVGVDRPEEDEADTDYCEAEK